MSIIDIVAVSKKDMSMFLVALLNVRVTVASQFSETGCCSYKVHLTANHLSNLIREPGSVCVMNLPRSHCHKLEYSVFKSLL